MTTTEKYQKRKWEFPDYSRCCPICGSANCAVRIGYYFRKRIFIGTNIYLDIPIARWLCRRVNPAPGQHKTFSLLPRSLIPYYQIGLDLILLVASFKNQPNTTYTQTKDFIYNQSDDAEILLETEQINNFQSIVIDAFYKLHANPKLKQKLMDSPNYNNRNPIETVLDFIENYHCLFLDDADPDVSNAEKLTLEFFFHFQIECYFDRHFLFGTPSQKR
jgi:hypothetical protein